jgi:hypothetical protein
LACTSRIFGGRAVGAVDDDLPVEAARAQQRRVEDVGPVGAAIRMTLSFSSKPSISTSSWLRVCSRSSWPPPRPAPRWRPTASISSMKMMHGRSAWPARTGRGRGGADADEHLDEVGAGDREERHARLAGDGAREQRLAGAGRPYSSTPLGSRAQRLELLRVLEELLDLVQLLDGLVDAGDVLEADLRRVRRHPLGADLPKLITFEPPPCTWFIRKIQKANSRTNGSSEVKKPIQDQLPVPWSRSRPRLC